MELPIPDDEQQEIINNAIQGKNIIVNAIAGSGKTTTILNFGRQINKDILLITYNKFLRLEIKEKLKKYKIGNIEPHTYHSLAYKYYSNCNNDIQMKKIIDLNLSPKCEIKQNILVIDETQDQSYLYYTLLKKLCIDFSNINQIIIMGDENQVVYKVKAANNLFLKVADQIWKNFTSFERMKLSKSYRLTKPIASFINNIMLGEERIISDKEGRPVIYFNCNCYEDPYYLLIEIIEKYNYKADDVFILAPSLKINNNDTPVRKLERDLADFNHKNNNKYPIFFPSDDNADLNEEDIKDKIVFSTFNGSKGRERRLVIVFSFDASYYKYNGKNESTELCPDVFYVATSRAIEQLIIIKDFRNFNLPFLKENPTNLKKYIKYISTRKTINENIISLNNNDKYIITSPTKLVDRLDNEFEYYLDNVINDIFIVIQNKQNFINLPIKINNSMEQPEQISCINGLIIPTLFEANVKGKTTIHQRIIEYKEDNYHTSSSVINEAIDKTKMTCETLHEYTHLCTLWYSLRERLNHKLTQINNYDWLNTEDINKCIKRFEAIFIEKQNIELEHEIIIAPKYIEYKHNYECQKLEKFIEKNLGSSFPILNITGYIDCIYNNYIYEFKCTSKLENKHKLQLIIYKWLCSFYNNKYDNKKFRLFNICTNEILEIDNTKDKLINEIIINLLKSKYKDPEILEEINFIKKCNEFSINKKNIDIKIENLTIVKLKELLNNNGIKYKLKDNKNILLELIHKNNIYI